MNKRKWIDHGNETNQKDKKREKITLMLNECHVPEELEQRTLAAMTALREFQAEEEIREAERRAQGKTARNLIRAAAAAAALALIITVTPLRGYVASAAESFYHAVHSWQEDVSPVGITKSADGCTVELVEARLSNELMYLTFDEDYTEYADQIRQLHAEEPDLYDNLVLSADYTGEISDGEGHSIRFDNETMAAVENLVMEDNRNTEYEDTAHQIKQYRIYLPGLKELINSKKKTYTVSVAVSPKARYGGEAFETITTLNFSFALDEKTITPVLSSQIFDIDYSYTVGNVRFDFEKLYVGKTESSFAVALTPTGDLAGEDLRSIDVECVVCESPKGKEKRDAERCQAFLDREADMSELLEMPTFLCGCFGEGAAESVSNAVYVCGGKYYIFVSCDNVSAGSRYNYRNILTAAKKSRFRVLDLAYSVKIPVYEDDTLFWRTDTARVHLADSDASENQQDDKQEKTVYQPLSYPEINLERRRKGRYILSEDGDEGTVYISELTFLNEYKVGGLGLNMESFYYVYYGADNDSSAEYQASDFFAVRFYEPHINGRSVTFEVDGVSGDCCVRDIVFFGQRDGKTVSRFDGWVSYNINGSEEIRAVRANDDSSLLPPDRLVLGYVRYALYDAASGKYTNYVYYHPDYYTDEGVSKETLREQQAFDDFRENSFFTVKS